MPEGDTIHKVAAALAAILEGCPIEHAGARRLPRLRLAGARVQRVRAQGKHLFVDFDTGGALRVHLGLYGGWHRYAPGESWRKPAQRASLVLETARDVCVCFNAREVEWLRADGVRRRHQQSRLGPDLALAGVDFLAVAARARALLAPPTVLADVLLDQRVAAGIGNVYKSEVAFIERVHPAMALAAIDDDTLAGLFSRASDLIRRNLGGGPRTTRFERDDAGRLWVYGRASRPCLRCAAPVVAASLGQRPRITYSCPACQGGGAL